MVAVDLLGGTPSNCCSRILAQREIEVIAGMNLPMLMQYLADREGIGEMDPHTVVESGQKGVVHQNELLACTWDDDE